MYIYIYIYANNAKQHGKQANHPEPEPSLLEPQPLPQCPPVPVAQAKPNSCVAANSKLTSAMRGVAKSRGSKEKPLEALAEAEAEAETVGMVEWPRKAGKGSSPPRIKRCTSNFPPQLSIVPMSVWGPKERQVAVGTKISTPGLKVPLRPPSGPVTYAKA